MRPLLLVFAIYFCTNIAAAQTAAPAPVKEVLLDGLKRPWSMAFISEEEVIVAEKEGGLLRVNLVTKHRAAISGFPDDLADSIGVTDTGDNAGIFQVLLDPAFSSNRQIYVSYAAKGDGGTTTRFIRAMLHNNSLQYIQTLFTATPFSACRFHYGGAMCFGTDGKLYFTVGERLYNEIDEPAMPIAQNTADKRGKIYRINPDGSIPADNPDFGAGAVPGLYATGIRAAQGFAIEPGTGTIWFSEHGTLQGDELNVLQPHANYGWPVQTTGKYRSAGYQPPTLKENSYTAPVWYWLQTVAPTGLCFYTGTEFPGWKNDLIVPGLSRGSLWRFRIVNGTVKSVEELLVDDRVRLRKAVQSPGGQLYLLTDEKNGKIIRLVNERR